MLIFVSHWQMQNYIAAYNIPWSRCAVIRNAIEPFERHDKPQDGTIRLAYWSTPHRGLELLIPAFEAISVRRPNVVLDVYSSFNLYGWPQRDEQYKPLFEKCKAHPKINYHGSVSNETLREALKDTHIFAYPSIWPETSCLCLIEAMSARLVCVHSSLAALPETSLSQTYMYQFNENPDIHASDFASFLDLIIGNYWSDQVQVQITNLKVVADNTYNLERFSNAWNALLTELASRVESGQMRTEIEGAYFTYKT
jgi:glycosyltransferase involved in cell wall biosynthesis